MANEPWNEVAYRFFTTGDVTPSNITTKFREAFEDLSDDHWTTVAATGDIVQVDGNAAAASYLSISKSPWDAGTETELETVARFNMPVEIAVEFAERVFEQTVLLKKPADLQAYADAYEADFAALPAEPAFVEAQE
jgi:hypothetical protein